MVAQVDPEAFSNILHTPAPDPADSQDVALALETARALETTGDIEEATRWIRRAADYAERVGHDERVLVLALAAVDLTQTIASRVTAKAADVAPSSVPTLNVKGRNGSHAPKAERDGQAEPTRAHPSGMPPMLAALVASLPSFSARSSSSAPPPSVAQARSSSPATPSDKPPTERTMRIGAIRVAIRGSIHETKSLSVERLDKDEPTPAGSIEGMLVLTGPIDGSLEIATNLPVGDGAARRP